MGIRTYALATGAILAAAALLAAVQSGAFAQQNNGTGKEFSKSLLPDGNTQTNSSAGGNFTIGQEGFGGNETRLAGSPYPVDTTALKMHIDEAKSAMQSNDTQGAMNHMILALEEIESIFSGNSTMTSSANTTSAMSGNMTTNSSMMMP